MTMLLLEAKKGGKGKVPKRRPLKTKKSKAARPAGDDPGFTAKELASGVKPPGVLWGVWGPALKAYQKGGKGSHKAKSFPKAKPRFKKKSPLPHLSPSYRKTHSNYSLRIGQQIVSRWKKRWGSPETDNIYDALVSLAKRGEVAIPYFVHDAAIVDTAGKVVARALGVTVPGGKKGAAKGKAPGKKLDISSLIANDPFAGDDWGDAPSKQAWPMGHWTKGTGGGSWKHKPKPVVPLTPEEKKLYGIIKKMHSPLERTAAGGIVFKTFEGADVWELPVLVAQTAAKYGGTWVFPKGGLDPGETLKRGAVREVREEVGVKAKIAGSHVHVAKSKFGDSGKYDIAVVMAAALKAAGKADKNFVEGQKQALCRKYYTWQNETHYFVMKWAGGKPSVSHVEHGTPECTNKHPTAEMQAAKWVTLAHATTMSARMKSVVEGLLRTIIKLWTPPAGVKKTKPTPLSSLRTPRTGPKPKQINPKSPKPSTGGKPPKPHKQTGLTWSGLY